MRQLAAEFVGTFFLNLAICLAVTGSLGSFAPVAIGLMLTVMVYACGHLSGAQFNPAVSLAFYLRGKNSLGEALVFSAVQVVAACGAALVAMALVEKAPDAVRIASAGAAVTAEAVGAFALTWVVLNVATARATAGNSFYGIAIGMTVTAAALTLGRFSGGAFNPSVAVGGALFGLFRWGDIWLHIFGSCIGGTIAAFAFRATHPEETKA